MARVRHAFRPDVKPATLGHVTLLGNGPHAPDAFPFVEARIVHAMFAQVAFGKRATAVGELVAPLHDEGANPIAAFTGEDAVVEGEPEFHEVPARNPPI